MYGELPQASPKLPEDPCVCFLCFPNVTCTSMLASPGLESYKKGTSSTLFPAIDNLFHLICHVCYREILFSCPYGPQILYLSASQTLVCIGLTKDLSLKADSTSAGSGWCFCVSNVLDLYAEALPSQVRTGVLVFVLGP
jgi:hypothetical protein